MPVASVSRSSSCSGARDHRRCRLAIASRPEQRDLVAAGCAHIGPATPVARDRWSFIPHGDRRALAVIVTCSDLVASPGQAHRASLFGDTRELRTTRLLPVLTWGLEVLDVLARDIRYEIEDFAPHTFWKGRDVSERNLKPRVTEDRIPGRQVSRSGQEIVRSGVQRLGQRPQDALAREAYSI